MDPFTGDLFSVFNVNSFNNAPKKRKNIEELAEEAKLEALSSNQDSRKKKKLSTSSKNTMDLNVEVIEVSDEDAIVETSANGPNEKIVKQKESEMEEEKKVISTDNETPKAVVVSHTTPTTIIDASMNAKLGEKNACLHEVALPPDFRQKLGADVTDEDVHKMLFDPAPHTLLPDYKPAKQYPFTLDAFQEEAVKSIERGQSVLVSAHTSAGKTAVAEYAIALSLKKGSRVVYTSPIKALSNQKYRELQEEFEDVGLMTGDVTISPNASCIVMTTEILRSMLYRGSELLNEVAWVIFDEVHYMRDKERGVVWEETLILLPNTVRYVFLSATIPNAMEFAEWIAKLKGQPVHVVYTDYRPTPLQHYIYPSGGDGIHLVVDGKTGFREEAFRLAIEALNNTNAAVLQPNGEGGHQTKSMGRNLKEIQGNNVYRLVNMIMKRNFQPVIVFSFSRKDCENRALAMSKLDLLNGDEEEISLVEEVFHNAIDALSEDDKKLPQVEHMLPLLKKGIGIHHSGLLPIIKEVIEILFQEGLVKVLFATETFAMGLNMPARTFLFTSCEKFDGRDFRYITSGEYIQMSGRAGRRGIDEKGIVILMLEKEIDLNTIKQIMSGMPDPLNSSFHLSYYMILNLLRVEEISPQYIMERSFYQFQSEKLRPALEAELKKLEEEHSAIAIENEQQVASYYRVRQELMELKRKIQQEVNKPAYCLNFVNTGRLVKVNCSNTTSSTDELNSARNEDWGWGVIVNYQKKKNVMNTSSIKELKSSDYTVDILLQCAPNSDGKPRPFNKDKLKNIQDGNEQKNKNKGKKKKKSGLNSDESNIKPDYVILPVDLTYIEKWSSIRIYMNKNLKSRDNMESCYARVAEAERRLKNSSSGIPLLDPIEDMKIPAEKLQDTIKRVESLEQRLVTNEIHKHERLEELYNAYVQKLKLEEEISDLKKRIRAAGQLALKEDLKKMTRVLRRLDCISNPDKTDAKSDGVITVKGRVACEISSADELVITEMIFNGILNDLTPEQVVALMSCCAFQEGGSSGGKKDSNSASALPEELKKPYEELVKAAKRVAKVSIESKIEMDEDEYISSFNPELMQVTYAWCHGAKFHEICKMTDVFEGSIVRVMRRLEELLRQMCAAAKAIGDEVLEAKLNEGINKLKKDIVFSSSLYL
jgi:ATP-dependent RNA helicase DOB1